MFNKTASTPPTSTPNTGLGAGPGAAPRPTPPTPAPTPSPSPTTTASASDPMARRPSGPARSPSLLGPDLVFEGTLTGEGELHIEGSVRGEIQVPRLTIGDRALVEGAVRCGQVEVRGKMLGNIEAKSVKLYESAHVEGDIQHEQLSIDVGAFFQGRCQAMKRTAPAAAPAPSLSSAPAKPEAPARSETSTANGAGAQVAELEKNAG